MDFNFDEINDELSDFNVINGVNYLKPNHKLDDNQAFFVTHLEIREFNGVQGAGGRKMTNLLDSVGRENGTLKRSKAEKRVKHTNKNHGKDWFLIEVGMIIDLVD